MGGEKLTNIKEKKTDLNKMNDAAFKAIFRSEEARGILSTFLQQVTNIPKNAFMSASYVGGELTKGFINEKGQTADILIKIDSLNKKLLVEMNQTIGNYKNQDKVRGAMKIAVESKEQGEEDKKKKDKEKDKELEISLININNFNLYNVNVGIQIFKHRDQLGNKHIVNTLTTYDIVLENLLNPEYNDDIVLRKFAEFLKTDCFKTLREIFEGDEEYMDAINKAESLSMDPDFNVYYDYEENLKKSMELDLEQAKMDGLAEGHTTGLTEGHAMGLAEGQKQFICKMHEKGMSVQEISSMLELSEDEIENFLKL